MSEEKKKSTEPVEPNVEESKPEETVVVSKDFLKKMEDRMNRLEGVASKAKLGIYDKKHKGPLGKVAGIRKIGGKYVVGWSGLTVNTVEQNVITGKWEEIQELEVYFIDKTKAKMTYKQWKDRYTVEECPVISEKIVDGKEEVTLELPEGDKVTLDVKFIN